MPRWVSLEPTRGSPGYRAADGIDDTQESRDSFFEILDGALEAGIAAVTVHGRTVRQGYVGPSRWEFLREVKRYAGEKTILGSGDLFTAEDCLRMMRQTGVDGVTVARGAIGNPWIFSQARALAEGKPLPSPPTIYEQADVMREHYRLSEQLYGDSVAGQARKFGIKYSALHPDYESVRADMNGVRSPEDWEDVLKRWYTYDGPGCDPSGRLHKAQGARSSTTRA